MRIGLLLKITPENLGVLQLGSGAVFSAIGYSTSARIFISVWQQASMLLISIPIFMEIAFLHHPTLAPPIAVESPQGLGGRDGQRAEATLGAHAALPGPRPRPRT